LLLVLSFRLVFYDSIYIYLQNGVGDIKNHRWFANINWDDLLNLKIEVNPTIEVYIQ